MLIQGIARNVQRGINVVSKTAFEKFNKCALQAYLSRKHLTKKSAYSDAITIGLLAHSLANARVESFCTGSNVRMDELYAKYSPEIIFETMRTMKGFETLEKHFEKLEQLQSEVTYNVELPEVAEGFKLTARFDAIGIRTIGSDSFCVVIDWKSGMLVNNAIDDEALLYSYVAFRTFGLPVIFTRVSLRTGFAYSEILSPDEILAMEQVYITKFKSYKGILEAPTAPRSSPGSHCLYCPFLEECPTKDYDPANLENKFSLLEWATQLAKTQDTFLKDAGKEVLKNEDQPLESLSDNTKLLIPGTNMSVVCSTSTSYQSVTRSVKKADIVKAMIDNQVLEEHPEFLENVDIKLNSPEIADVVQNLGFGLKAVTRNTVTIKSNKSEDVEGEEQ